MNGFFSGKHLVNIASDGIDLAVMHHQTVGMGTQPTGICIGRESGMYHSNGRSVIFVLQIGKEGTQLTYQKHTLIDNSSAG